MDIESNRETRELLSLVEERIVEDFVRELLAWALRRIMEADVGAIFDIGRGDSVPEEREPRRNGYRRRCWDMQVGTTPPNIPKLREGVYLPCFAEWPPDLRESLRDDHLVGQCQRSLLATCGQADPVP